METLQGTLGQALLVLIAVAILLFAVILVLVEADFILGLLERLARRWKTIRPGAASSGPPALDQSDAERPRHDQGVQ